MHIEKPATYNLIDVDFQPQQLPPFQTLLSSNQSCQLLNQVSQIIDTNPASELATSLQAIAEKLRQFLDTQQIVIYSIRGNDSTVAPNSLISSPNLNHTNSNHSIAVPIFTHNFSISGASTKERVLWGILIANGYSLLSCEQQECSILKLIAREISVAIQQAQLLTKLQAETEARNRVETQANQYLQQIDHQSLYIEQIQQQLLSKEKIATLGELIVDLVKEIQDPVEFIFNTLYSASQYAEDLIQLLEHYEHYYPTPPATLPTFLQSLDTNFIKTDFIKLLWSLRAGSEQLQKTVSALHNFSDDDSLFKKINLNHTISGAIAILQHRLKQQQNRPGIEVVKEFGNIPLVECLPSEINQVFISLLTNAIEALEERMNYDNSFIPKIWISTEIVRSHLSLLNNTPAPSRTQKQKVLIHIYDNGTGILPHIQRRMFEPFFTTKPIRKSMGLGLAISKQIIEQNHRGKLRCNSQLGHGTEFVIEICTFDRHNADIKKHAQL